MRAIACVAMLVIFLSACGPGTSSSSPQMGFPDGFKWGTATAGFQVDMGCPTWSDADCLDDASDWYQWVTDPSIVEDSSLYVSGDPLSDGPGMWEMFEADVLRMQEAGHNGYRMSIEWSRLFPNPETETAQTVDDLYAWVNEAAVSRYHEMFSALRDAEIEPMVTLNHYTLPLWVHNGVACHENLETCEASGWVDGPRMVRLIGLYAGFVGEVFGGEVDKWLTLNEPFAAALSGYALPGEMRSSPPGLRLNYEATVDVMLHQIEGHAAMYDGVKSYDTVGIDDPSMPAEVGIVMNMTAFAPMDASRELDMLGVEHADYLYHQLYLNALTTGEWDPDLDGVSNEIRDDLANRLDFIGVNYYNQVVVTGFPISLSSDIPIFDFFPDIQTGPYAAGLFEVVERAADWGLPVFVTENGTAGQDTAVEFLESHLGALQDAVDLGIDVRGFYYWSFVDNYEWNLGYSMEFGLLGYDLETKERISRPHFERYEEIIRNNAL